MEWIAINWELISAVAVVLIFVLNATTRHFSQHAGLVKVLLIVVEYLSLIRSKDVQGLFKLPLTSAPPHTGPGPVKDASMLVLLFAVAALSGCATTPRGYISKALEATAAADKVVPAAVVAKCKDKDEEKRQQCVVALEVYRSGMDTACSALETVNAALEMVGVE